MAIVVKWAFDGKYLTGLGGADGLSTWDPSRSNALRFENQADARRRLSDHFGRPWPVWERGWYKFIRLVPRKRHASPQP